MEKWVINLCKNQRVVARSQVEAFQERVTACAHFCSCTCLENPMEDEAWWAAFYGVNRVGHD